MLSLPDAPNSPTRFQGLLSAEHELNAMLQLDLDPATALEMYLDPFLGCEENIIVPRSPAKSPSVENSLVKFREEMEQRIAAIDTYYSEDHSQIIQRCKDEDAGSQVDNPGTSLLICSKDFINIIQRLAPATHSSTQTTDELSTELALLVLSSYLALMRLFDSLFHRIHRHLCNVSLESYRSLKVKSVLRIGGVSALQDMPLKAYAMVIIDAIQCQVRTLEQYMGIPREYCLFDKPTVSDIADASGIFSRPDRTRLFWAVMAQEDLKPQRESRSYVDSIRANIKESMEFFND
ncbi:hypothetical protein VHEMI10356 [[Torrubiella] hemipterigena]|uniref:Uncharacterized protein n=1 Tax=[Torrubiella] hemipterigena TaxID=1531966 RepID=A0A0A1TT55_9HYPO|nr:hypothetical protein VHEMI10356 [[Torrubiella] hemipterigena]